MLHFRYLLRRVALAALFLGLLAPTTAQAARDEVDTYTVDDYLYDHDGLSAMAPEDDPGNGGPAPTAVPLGSDVGTALLLLAGAWYARRSLRRTSAPAPTGQ